MAIDLILGTAGHIDHGKTALVKALTGVDTDRLPEEKRRGITIDLGFAELDLGEYRLGIVDVPGHERFVRNMLAGATGIDLALLVVAADDSVKPQTREHLAILNLLELRQGVIALTKADLADPAWIDLVEQEIRELVAGTFLADAPLVRTSALTGLGLDALRQALAEAAARAVGSSQAARQAGPFRLPIDRVFTLPGHGTVVTGSVVHGSARVGDELVIEPGGLAARVRGLQNHGRAVEAVHRGQRAAVNLAGVHHEQIVRGHELASAGFLAPSRLLSVEVRAIEGLARPIRNRSRVRVHLGTADLMASLSLLEADELAAGQQGLGQLFLSEPAVATWGQPLVLRQESPLATIGGGRVLDPNPPRIRRRQSAAVDALRQIAAGDRNARASAACYFAGFAEWQPVRLARSAGIDDGAEAMARLIDKGELLPLVLSPQRTLRVHRQCVAELEGRIESLLLRMHRQNPLATMLDRSRLINRLGRDFEPAVVEAVLRRMEAADRVRLPPRAVALAGQGPQLSDRKRQLMESMVEAFRTAAFQPPGIDELRQRAEHNQAAVPELVELAVADGRLVRIGRELFLHAEAEARLREQVESHLAAHGALTVSQIRELLGTTRKYAVPLCEYLDGIGLTRREGDLRVRATQPPA